MALTPDPSTNHNIACVIRTMREPQLGSLKDVLSPPVCFFWILGKHMSAHHHLPILSDEISSFKPDLGKCVFCFGHPRHRMAAVIDFHLLVPQSFDIIPVCEARKASMRYFYFTFGASHQLTL
jgi:hypothetical protein